MDPLIGGALISGGIGLLGDLFNVGQQSQNLQYQKRLQQQLFEREDSAVQRRVADLRAAGLSPTLAAGSAAGAGSVVHTTAPQSEAGERAGKTLAGAMELAMGKIGLRKLDAEAGRSEADRRRAEADAAMAQARVPYADKLAALEWKQKIEDVVYRTQGSNLLADRGRQEQLKAQFMEMYGMSNAEAENAVARVRAEMDRYYAESEKKGGAGFRGQAEGWVGLAAQILNAIRGGQSVFMRGGR